MARNFYVVLGVSRDADPHEIKRAYRNLVKRFHPDRGLHPADKFMEVQEAYQNLLDPDTRRRHDLQIGERAPRSKPSIAVTHTVRTAPPARPAEPLAAGEQKPGDLFAEVDEFFAGFVPGIFSTGRGASRKKDLYVELELTPMEAGAGGMFPLEVPVERACPQCRGRGVQDLLICAECRGQGRVVEYHQIQITAPPGVEDGEVQRIPLTDIGLPKANLVVLVTVSP